MHVAHHSTTIYPNSVFTIEQLLSKSYRKDKPTSIFSSHGQAALIAACLICILPCVSFSQIPHVGIQPEIDALTRAQQWNSIGASHAAQQVLSAASLDNASQNDNADFSFEVVTTAFKTQDYEASFFQSATFLYQFPEDTRKADVLFIEGISAFQIGKFDTSFITLNAFLSASPNHPLRGLAYYWRARCRLEQKDWQNAESDFRLCAEDTLTHSHHDDALLGWSLALERRGEHRQAAENLQQFINNYPQSDLISDARIRLASLKLRLGDPRSALAILQDTRTQYRYQREESLLLRAEGNFQLGFYDSARVRYERFLKDFPESRFTRNARYGHAWTNLKLGNIQPAQAELDMLGSGTDTLAMTALFQNATISLLSNNTKEASARFDSLVQVFPYEQFSDNAYYQLGMLAYRAQHYQESRKHFQLAARLFPESELRFQSYRMMGEASMALRDFSNAQYAFSQVRKLGAPDSLLAPAMFQEGVSLYHLGRFKSSAERFDMFLKQFPRHTFSAEGYIWKGEALYQDYRFDEAEKAFSDGVRLFPLNPKRQDAQYGIAWSFFEQKKFSRAVDAFDQFIKNYPKSDHRIEASLRKADCYYFLGEYQKSENLYASLAAEKSQGRYNEYAVFQIAMSYIQRGDADRGIQHLRNFLTRYPSSMYCEVVQFNIAWTYFSKEQFPDALTEFKTFLQKYPGSQLLPRVFFNMGDAYYNSKSYDSARVYYSNVLTQFPQSPLAGDALSGLEYTYRTEGKTTEALQAIEKFSSAKLTGTNQEELGLKKADILFGQNEFASAIQEYQRVLSMKPDKTQQAKAILQIGKAYEFENNLQQAIPMYRQIVDNFSDNDAAPSVALALGVAYVKTKQLAQAKDIFKLFETKFPGSPLVAEARYHLATTFLELKETEQAFNQFLLVISKHSSEIFAERSRLHLAQLLQNKKEYKASIDTLEGVIGRRSDDLAAEALIILGDTYLSMKRNGDALQAFLDVIDQYKEFGLLVERGKLGAGEAYTRLFEKKKARKMYQEIIDAPIDLEVKKEAQERLRKIR